MRTFQNHFLIFMCILVGACQPRPGASKIEALIDVLHETVLHKNWNGIVKLSINPEDAKHVDAAIMFAPSNRKLLRPRYLPASKAENEWPEMRGLLRKKFRVDYLLLLDWEYPTANGAVELQQFFAIHENNHRYFIVF